VGKKSVTRVQRGTLIIDMFPYGCDQAFLQDYIFPLMVPSQILTNNICFAFYQSCLKVFSLSISLSLSLSVCVCVSLSLPLSLSLLFFVSFVSLFLYSLWVDEQFFFFN